jgi:hypothetical protein
VRWGGTIKGKEEQQQKRRRRHLVDDLVLHAAGPDLVVLPVAGAEAHGGVGIAGHGRNGHSGTEEGGGGHWLHLEQWKNSSQDPQNISLRNGGVPL